MIDLDMIKNDTQNTTHDMIQHNESKKVGRPKKINKRDKACRILMTEEENDKLNRYCEEHNQTRSQVFVRLLQKL